MGAQAFRPPRIAQAPPAAAQTAQKTYCSEPVEPFCTKSDATFEDKAATESCQEDVTEFVAEMKQFAVCLGKQQSEARERAKAVQDRFACMAANRDDCGTR